jgi:hypothetical protein
VTTPSSLRPLAAASVQAPSHGLGAPFTPSDLRDEDPSLLKVGADTLVDFDASTKKHDRAMRSRDLRLSGGVASKLSFPETARLSGCATTPPSKCPLRSLLGCVVNPDQPLSWGGVAETPQHRSAPRVRPRMPNPHESALTALHVAP